jgi:hypothetical protein
VLAWPVSPTATQKLALGHDTEFKEARLLPTMCEGADHDDPL